MSHLQCPIIMFFILDPGQFKRQPFYKPHDKNPIKRQPENQPTESGRKEDEEEQEEPPPERPHTHTFLGKERDGMVIYRPQYS